jgi:predicted nucleotidyltransferase
LDAETDRAARTFVGRVSEHYDVLGAVVFGSRARRSHRPDSDADIAILQAAQLRGRDWQRWRVLEERLLSRREIE